MHRSAVCSAMLLIVLALASFATPSALPVGAPLAAAPAPAATEIDEPAPQDDATLQAINFVQIAAGENHTCGLTNTGLVYCWGWNRFGQLGDGTMTESLTPVEVSGLSGAIAIATSSDHTCALLTSGAVRCWGSNLAGQLGDGTTDDQLTPVEVNGLNGTVAITAGGLHTCALLTNGSARCWGSNSYGQLGDGTTTNRRMSVTVSGLSGAVTLAAGDDHTCALLRDGTARCWGYNYYGQLGDGTTDIRLTPVAVSGLSDAVAITAGYGHTCALLSDGTARCWGSNWSGLLGDGTTTRRLTPVPVSGLSGAVAIASGDEHTCAALTDGSARCWGSNSRGQLGDGTPIERRTPVAVNGLSGAVAITAGGLHTCALLRDGTARCWGDNEYGQLGDGTTDDLLTLVAVSGLSNAVAITAGSKHTCALLSNGTARCWGQNYYGQLGDGTTDDRLMPVAVSGLSNAVAISAGFQHTCALLRDDTARCWGDNEYGQLGDGTRNHRLTPAAVSGLSNAVAISAGFRHTCALLRDGTARCWGSGYNQTPVEVGGLSGVVALSAGGGHDCALLRDGTVRCWGWNGSGQLGDGTTTRRLTPVPVSGLSGAVAIASGDEHTCAALTDGSARCWGYNFFGQLGDSPLKIELEKLTPVAVSGLSDASAISADMYHTCALLRDGTARCWGRNWEGQLGDGTASYSLVPVTVAGSGGGGEVHRRPLIFIPGIMGSYIYDLNNKELWPGICDPGRDDKLREKSRNQVLVPDVIRTYTGNASLPGWALLCVGRTDIVYASLIARLKQHYQEYPDISDDQRVYTTPLQRCQIARNAGVKPTLFVFAYDWRQSNAENARELKQYIDCIREIHGNTTQVDILTHSMGGLVARRYLLDNRNNHHIARLITVAAPFLGAPRGITAIVTGEYPGVAGPIVSPIYGHELKHIAETSVGAHELLPSPAYFRLAHDSDSCPLKRWSIRNGRQEGGCTSFEDFQAWIDQRIAFHPGQNARQFHTYLNEAQNDWRRDPAIISPMPAYYHIYGVAIGNDGLPLDNTLGSVEEVEACEGTRSRYRCSTDIRAGKTPVPGDQTVTLLSAERISESENHNAPGARLIPVLGSAKSTEHTELVKVNPGLDEIMRILLSGQSPAEMGALPAEGELPSAEAHYMQTSNVLSLTVADANGNDRPPHVSFYPLSEGSYFVVFPPDEVFTATIEFKDQEAALLEFRTGTGTTTSRAIRYQDLLVDGNRKAQIIVGPQGFLPLQRDANADGIFETVIPSTVDVTGAAANDLDAPVVTISATGPLDAKTVTITATDSGAGVKQVLYSLDRTTFQPYTAPFVVDARQTPVVYAFADDNVANRSSLLTGRLAWPIYLPLTVR